MPAEEETTAFLKYHFSKEANDDVEVFTHIARIPYARLKRVDQANLVLVEYLKTINPNVETGKLLAKEVVGPSKKLRKSKKDATTTPEKPVQEPKKRNHQRNRRSQNRQFQML